MNLDLYTLLFGAKLFRILPKKANLVLYMCAVVELITSLLDTTVNQNIFLIYTLIFKYI